jgi:type I restriction enzyme S subunit
MSRQSEANSLEEIESQFPTTRLKFGVERRTDKFDTVPEEVPRVGLDMVESWTGEVMENREEEPQASTGLVKFRPGDVCFSKLRPYLAKAFEAEYFGAASPEFLVFQPIQFETRFLRYLLLSREFIERVDASTYGAKMPRASWNFIGNVRVPCPDKREQNEIADFLDRRTARIDALVEKQKRLLDLLNEKRQAFITRAVTEGLDSTVAAKSTEVEWLGEIPEHWDTTRTRFVARLESGHTPSKSNDEYWTDTDIPWVSLADSERLRENDRIAETEHYTNQKGLNNSSAHILPTGTVVFTRDATVGLCAILDCPMAVAQHLVGWVCGPKILPEYLLSVFKSMDQELDLLTRGSTISTIGMPDIRSLNTPLPPVDEQREIVEHIQTETERLWTLIDNVEEAIDLLEEKRQALITAAVTGQIDGIEDRGAIQDQTT